MSLRRVGIVAVSVVGALLAAAVLYIAFGDLGRHKGRIEALVTDAVGRPFAIEGAFEVKLLPEISLVAERVRLGNAAWGTKPQMVEVGRFAARVGLWSVISGPVDVRSFELSDVAVLLETDASGKGNWAFGEARDSEEEEQEASGPGPGATKVPAVIQDARLANLRLAFHQHGKPARAVQVESLTIGPGHEGLLALSGKGRVDEHAFGLAGELGPLGALVAGRDIRMALQASLGSFKLEAKGAVGRLDPLDGADLVLKAGTADLGAFLKSLQLAAPVGGPLSIDAQLKDAGELTRLDLAATLEGITAKVEGMLRTLGPRGADLRFLLAADRLSRLGEGLPAIPVSLGGEYTAGRGRTELKDLKGKLGASQLAGRVTLVQSGRTRVEGELTSPRLDLTPFTAGDGKKPKPKPKPAPAKKYVFGEDKLQLDGLRALDAKLRVAAGELVLGDASLKEFDTTLNLERGRLALETRAKGGIDGTLGASIALATARSGPAEVKASVSAKALRTGGASGKSIDPKQAPPNNLELTLTAKGASPRELASGANGRVLLTQGPGKMDSNLIGLFGGDTIGQVASRLNPFAAKDPYTQLDCTVARVDIVDGQATVKPVLMQSEKVTVVAGGAIDLRSEEMAIHFNTKPRTGVGISPGMFTNPFVEIGGTLASPRVGFSAKGAASAGAAAATGGLSVLAQGLWDRIVGSTDQCKDTLAEATK